MHAAALTSTRLACVALALSAVAAVSLNPSAVLADDDENEGDEGVAQVIKLTGTIRDFAPDVGHPDFTSYAPGQPGVKTARNVALTLDMEDKPMYIGGGTKIAEEWKDGSSQQHTISWCAPYCSDPADQPGAFTGDDDGGITSNSTFAQWYRDVPGINMSELHSIDLTLNDSDVYTFDTVDFFPIDEKLFGNGEDDHNFFFTFELVCSFKYQASADQYFWFKGDDDCWIFIDGKMVIDQGGIAAGRGQRIDFDRLALVDGQTYLLHLFLAERYRPQSQMHIKTNVKLESAGSQTVFAAYD